MRPSGGGRRLRWLAYVGARHGPRLWLRWSPPFFGLLFFACSPGARRVIRENLRRVRGAEGGWREGRDVARTFVHYAQCLAEGLGADRPDAEAARCEVVGVEPLLRSINTGRGAVLVTAHVGPWDAAAALLCRRLGARLTLVMAEEADPDARRLHDAVRNTSGVDVVRDGAGPLSVLGLVRTLKAGGLVALQLDRPAPSGRAIEVELLGRRASVPLGPFLLAAHAGVPLVVLLTRRVAFQSYTIKVHAPLELAPRPTLGELKVAAQGVADRVQEFILEDPTQWFHFGAERESAPARAVPLRSGAPPGRGPRRASSDV